MGLSMTLHTSLVNLVTAGLKFPQMSERRSSTTYTVVEQPDHHCGDDLVSVGNIMMT